MFGEHCVNSRQAGHDYDRLKHCNDPNVLSWKSLYQSKSEEVIVNVPTCTGLLQNEGFAEGHWIWRLVDLSAG